MKNRAIAYTCNGPSPLFFDPEGRGDLLVPSCYALWRCPHMLEKLFTYSEVSPKVSMQHIALEHLAWRAYCTTNNRINKTYMRPPGFLTAPQLSAMWHL